MLFVMFSMAGIRFYAVSGPSFSVLEAVLAAGYTWLVVCGVDGV
jgi:NADH:ubiquinone oxidoreductase subunit 2 (subunit N)